MTLNNVALHHFKTNRMDKVKQLGMYLLALSFVNVTVTANAADAAEQKIQINKLELYDHNNLITVAALTGMISHEVPEEIQIEDLPPEDAPLTSEGGVFGERYDSNQTSLHGSLGLSGQWTDNLYNTKDDKTDSLLTTLSAGAWYTFPKRYRKPIHIISNNTSPGGLQFSQADNKFYNKYEFFIGGNINYRTYSEDSDLNQAVGTLTGMWSYTPSPKLSFQISDQYAVNQDQFDISNASSENQRVFGSNNFSAFADWQIAAKFAAKAQYTNFGLVYDDAVNDFLNRNDHGLGLSGYYNYSQKTNFFMQYNTILAGYDEEQDEVNRDNSNGYLYGGVNWQSTIRTSLMAKAGYQFTNYDYDEFEDTDSFTFEAQWSWKATVKTSLLLDSTYSIEQSDSRNALNKTVLANRIGLNHRFFDRLNGNINFIYENSDYEQFDDTSRVDDRGNASAGVQFAVAKWLGIGASYAFDYKDSSIDELDYETNIVNLVVNGSF
ncbi:MAG: outer membrane beta-barrel protein [Desulfobulbaceae bacterium]|nr:outer membrane beta-barrel protein [Desulfobulbaceae bacterium]